jgi:hypothetical protein
VTIAPQKTQRPDWVRPLSRNTAQAPREFRSDGAASIRAAQRHYVFFIFFFFFFVAMACFLLV